MKLLVAIHDVTPAHAAAVERLWHMCEKRRVLPALFVVPNWHGAWPLEDFRFFTDWTRARAAEGADIFLHGERHDEIGLPRHLSDEVRAIGRTDREGEFLTLNAGAASARIGRGVARLKRVGLSPMGFVAPAWLARRDCAPIVRDHGLRVSEDARAIYLHTRGTRLESPVVRWSARTEWRARVSPTVVSLASWRHRRHWLVRIALHPQDLAHESTLASIEATLDHWVSQRTPWAYAAL
jgi:uncharacterized protein